MRKKLQIIENRLIRIKLKFFDETSTLKICVV